MIRMAFIFLTTVLLVASCGSRTQFDRQLVEGCKAGAEHVLQNREPAYTLQGVNDTNFVESTIANGGRKVVMKADIQQADGSGFPEEREIVCHFQESISFAGLIYSPTFHQIKLDDTRYGRDENGDLINDIQSFTALNDVVTQALNQAGS